MTLSRFPSTDFNGNFDRFRWVVTVPRGVAAATNNLEDAQFIADSLVQNGESGVVLIDTLKND